MTRREKIERYLKTTHVNPGHWNGLIVAELRALWRVLDAVTQALHLPGDEDTENDLIIAWEAYHEGGEG